MFRYRLTIGHQTCVFDKENDPTVLRTSAPGKLINYLQEDGSHMFVGQAYAEIEVGLSSSSNIVFLCLKLCDSYESPKINSCKLKL